MKQQKLDQNKKEKTGRTWSIFQCVKVSLNSVQELMEENEVPVNVEFLDSSDVF